MVMHARKPQRIGDGYFEKHQAHPYQNSKYSSSKGSYDRDRIRERDSPNGNSYRSESPECDSPRDRSGSYHGKTIYLSKSREKERENRDYKSRDKYTDCVRSPKDSKRSRDSRDSEHRTNHDRNSSEDKRGDDRERVVRVGDWSEHLSSSGKKYYYNCKTEVSQWEKPREWLEPRTQPTSRHNYSSQSSRTGGDKHSNSRGSVSSSSSKSGSSSVNSSSGGLSGSRQSEKQMCGSTASSNALQSSGANYWQPPATVAQTTVTTSSVHHQHDSESRKQDLTNNSGGMDGQATDMEICSDDSTPTSETSYSTTGLGGGGVAVMTPIQEAVVAANAPGPPLQCLGTVPPQAAVPVAVSSVTTTAVVSSVVSVAAAAVPTPAVAPIHVDTGCTPAQDTGPPTPTHSETQDCTDARKLLSPPSSLSSLQSLAVGCSLAAIRPQAPNLTPSLANHYRDDLVNHVRGWPADVLEKQAQKLGEEAHGLGSMCTRVSAELKCARSIVRLTEIQATLQEQRVLFLRQQIKNLEELKSQNSFMADEA